MTMSATEFMIGLRKNIEEFNRLEQVIKLTEEQKKEIQKNVNEMVNRAIDMILLSV